MLKYMYYIFFKFNYIVDGIRVANRESCFAVVVSSIPRCVNIFCFWNFDITVLFYNFGVKVSELVNVSELSGGEQKSVRPKVRKYGQGYFLGHIR